MPRQGEGDLLTSMSRKPPYHVFETEVARGGKKCQTAVGSQGISVQVGSIAWELCMKDGGVMCLLAGANERAEACHGASGQMQCFSSTWFWGTADRGMPRLMLLSFTTHPIRNDMPVAAMLRYLLERSTAQPQHPRCGSSRLVSLQ
jgi:hypothetical protein